MPRKFLREPLSCPIGGSVEPAVLQCGPVGGPADPTSAMPVLDQPAHVPEASTIRAKYTVELGCGTAGLSVALKRVGAEPLAVDHKHNRHRPKLAFMALDLSIDSGWVLLHRLLQDGKIAYVHAAPPCGTASRARDKPVPLKLRRKGHQILHSFAQRDIQVAYQVCRAYQMKKSKRQTKYTNE